MILRSLHLRRFGRFADSQWQFAPGLTVIRGPNEAGKSTMREGIVRLLLTEKKVDTRDKDYLSLVRWGSDRRFVLGCEFEAGGEVHELTRDFEARQVTLECITSAEVLTEEPAVAERMRELLGVSSRGVYETTACLAQQEFARLDEGRKVAELLQQTVVGAGGDTGAQAVLEELHDRIGALTKGLHKHAKNPGEVRATEDRIAALQGEITGLRPIVQRATEAADRIERARERVAEIDDELRQARRIRERAEKHRELEQELARVNEKFRGLDERVREAKELTERIATVEEELSELPDIEREQVEDLGRLVDAAELARERVPEAEQEAETAAEEAREAQERAQAAAERGPEEAQVRRAQRLQVQIHAVEDDVQQAEQAAERAAGDLNASRQATRSQRAWLVASAALIVGGAALGLALGETWPWVVAGVGLAVGVLGARRSPPMSVDEAERRHEEAADAVDSQRAELAALREQHDALLDRGDAADAEELSRRLEDARERAEKAREEHAAAAAVAKTAAEQAERARQQAQIHEARLQHRLEQLGAESARQFLSTASEVFDLRERRQALRARLEGLLGDDDVASLEDARSDAAADRIGLRQQLESEELTWAELDAESFEELQTRIERLEGEREALREEIDDARGAADHPDADPEHLRRLEEQLAGERRRLERVRERLEALELAHGLLAQAHEETLEGAVDVLEPRTSTLLADITDGRYCTVTFDRTTLEPSVLSPEKGCAVDPDDQLSCATREQVYLAARLALTDLLWPDEAPPIMLDDPFVNFDPSRREEALRIVARMAGDRQVLLFTCHGHYDQAADRVIELPRPSG